MSAPGRRGLTGSVSKLSVGVQTDGTYKDRLSLLLSSSGRDGRASASEGKGVGEGEGRVRVAPSEWCRLEGSNPSP